jgi:hypothetical protein
MRSNGQYSGISRCEETLEYTQEFLTLNLYPHKNVQKAIHMDKSKDPAQDVVRSHLKTLLLHLAAKSENPGYELQILLREVIDELHAEVKEAIQKKPHLRLIGITD